MLAVFPRVFWPKHVTQLCFKPFPPPAVPLSLPGSVDIKRGAFGCEFPHPTRYPPPFPEVIDCCLLFFSAGVLSPPVSIFRSFHAKVASRGFLVGVFREGCRRPSWYRPPFVMTTFLFPQQISAPPPFSPDNQFGPFLFFLGGFAWTTIPCDSSFFFFP